MDIDKRLLLPLGMKFRSILDSEFKNSTLVVFLLRSLIWFDEVVSDKSVSKGKIGLAA